MTWAFHIELVLIMNGEKLSLRLMEEGIEVDGQWQETFRKNRLGN